jgi:hypothetical protein
MHAILLLSAIMAGQVRSGTATAAQNRPATPAVAPQYVMRVYKIRYEGLTFSVRGYYRPDIGRIVWNEDDELNSRTYSMALITQPTWGDEQEEKPALVARPLIASRPAQSALKERSPASVTGMPVMQSRTPNSPRNSRN